MSEHLLLKEENLKILKELEKNPAATQREISDTLSISLGKVNYVLKALIKKGIIEVRNFSTNPGKLRKLQYHLTKEGLEYKINITRHFMEQKETEYNILRQELAQSLGETAGTVSAGSGSRGLSP